VSDYDLIISNGILVDGARTPRYRGDVGIRGDRIAALGDLRVQTRSSGSTRRVSA